MTRAHGSRIAQVPVLEAAEARQDLCPSTGVAEGAEPPLEPLRLADCERPRL